MEHEAFARAVEEMMRMINDNIRELEALRDEQRIQFKRIAQMQVELDAVRRVLEKLTTLA